MNKKRIAIFILKFIVVLLVILGIIMVWAEKSFEKSFSIYTELSDNEWIEIEIGLYNCNRGEFFGRNPMDSLGSVYSLKGFSTHDLLYVTRFYLWETCDYLFLDKDLEEPVKWLTIKKITSTKSDGSTINIVDASILSQYRRCFEESNRQRVSSSGFIKYLCIF